MESIPSLGQAENKEELWGLMLGQFKWVYAAFSLVGGYIADRFSRRFTICGSLFVWSAVTWWTGQVTTYYELLWARSLMGVSEAFYIPAALALITDYHQGKRGLVPSDFINWPSTLVSSQVDLVGTLLLTLIMVGDLRSRCVEESECFTPYRSFYYYAMRQVKRECQKGE